ncbi:type IV pilus twitching motility protein PilT [Acidobacteriota bacterium]
MDFNSFLKALLSLGDASDLHFKVGSPPLLRINGSLRPAKFNKLDAEATKRIAGGLLDEVKRQELDTLNDYDGSYNIPGETRFRVNIFRQRGQYSIILRVIPTSVPTLEELNLPEVIQQVALEPRGLILVTGITGSGKSTTLASMINYVNAKKYSHILTIEDPIEFIFQDNLSSINQREIGHDSDSFASALRAGLRQDPDIIMVGEMRDAETINIAVKAAETGHLVFSTLHTVDASRTINRIIDMYPADHQRQLRLQLSSNMKAIVSQRLLPKADGSGRIPAVEVMRTTTTIQEYIETPEKTSQIKDVIEAGRSQYQMQSFDQHLTDLYNQKIITLETALEAATSPSDFQRALTFEA